jgi:bifunctional non-homologous end joining protein LigD
MGQPLDEYRGRRDFAATPEPPGTPGTAEDVGARFVVQRHDARALHFDLRLKRDGVLASWAVPKGPPLREGVKRLAVRTEDHPLEYLDFAGTIPDGQYGAGLMTVWDRGTYTRQPSADDEWKLILEGRVLRGHYHLVRTGERGGREQWLLFRSRNGPPGPPDPRARFGTLRPMLASAAAHPPAGDDWAFELKWDGFRALALVTQDGTELRARSGGDLGQRFAGLDDLRRGMAWQEAVLDGELVVLDERGRADFQALQSGRGVATYVVFDVLYADGEWLCERPWSERRARLEAGLLPEREPRIMRSEHLIGRGADLLAAARAEEIEGVVAKRRGAPYRPGRRSTDWVKVKWRPEGEFVIVGWSEGAGSRRHGLGAVLVGAPDGGRAPAYRGAVGSGIGPDLAEALRARLAPLARPGPATADTPPGVRGAHWVSPQVRCRVEYAEVTADGRLRAPVFRGLVEDEVDPGRRAPAADSSSPGPDPSVLGGAGERVVRDGERRVRLTNLGKVWWPADGRSKGDAIDHYLRVAGVLVPHLAGRPMILKRFPNGITGEHFFQHNLPEGAPEWLGRAELSRSGRAGERTSTYALVDDPLALLWVVNLGCIDMNPWQSRAEAPDEPTQVLFDLDPGEGVPFTAVAETALLVRDELVRVGLRGYPRTSGASGMHVFVPLAPGHGFDAARLFAGVVGARLRRARPDLVTSETRVAHRGARVYLDANQNGRGRSIASVYSIRPRAGAPVATPLRWDEVGAGLDPAAFPPEVVAARIAAHGDLFAPTLTDLQELGPAVERLAG